MDDLIAALTIFRKYTNEKYPTNCVHDALLVNVDPDSVSVDDRKILEELGFIPSSEFPGCFISFRFG